MSEHEVHVVDVFAEEKYAGNQLAVVTNGSTIPDAEMQRIAARVGFSETAFAMPAGDAWRVRYFSPESEVPFCGHATIALGAALVGVVPSDLGPGMTVIVLAGSGCSPDVIGSAPDTGLTTRGSLSGGEIDY